MLDLAELVRATGTCGSCRVEMLHRLCMEGSAYIEELPLAGRLDIQEFVVLFKAILQLPHYCTYQSHQQNPTPNYYSGPPEVRKRKAGGTSSRKGRGTGDILVCLQVDLLMEKVIVVDQQAFHNFH